MMEKGLPPASASNSSISNPAIPIRPTHQNPKPPVLAEDGRCRLAAAGNSRRGTAGESHTGACQGGRGVQVLTWGALFDFAQV